MLFSPRKLIVVAAGLAVAGILSGASAAKAGTCDDWREEHAQWKAKVLVLRLRGAPQRELDQSMFELLQREAYLTSCDLPSRFARTELVGWRLVGRDRIDLSEAVIDCVLEQAGFGLDLAVRLGVGSDSQLAATTFSRGVRH